MKSWEVLENLLTLIDDQGVPAVPEASFVFDSLGYGTTTVGDVPNPALELEGISFSKRGSRLSFVIDLADDGSYTLLPRVTRLGKELDSAGLPISSSQRY